LKQHAMFGSRFLDSWVNVYIIVSFIAHALPYIRQIFALSSTTVEVVAILQF